MGLENLKSVFSDLKLPTPNVEKDTSTVSNLTSGVGQTFPTSPEVSTKPKSNLAEMFSEFGIRKPPQQVDYMSNEKAPGFTPDFTPSRKSLFTGIQGDVPNLQFSGNTLGYTNHDIEWPGPVNFIIDQKATGFTLDQFHKSPTLFTGASGLEEMFWTTDIDGGGSLYGMSEPFETVNYFPNTNASGFTANRIHKDTTEFVGLNYENTWDHTTSLYDNNNVYFPGPVDFLG